MRILVSAYACEPKRGSEPGVGWNIARGLALRHDVWVLTRANNRPAIESELAESPMPSLRFVYHDLPWWLRFWKRGGRGVQLYYYLWQLSARPVVRRIVAEHSIETCHHATFAKYWGPSAAALAGVHCVMGPLGGGDGVPPGLGSMMSLRGRAQEAARACAIAVAEVDPLVRASIRRAEVCIGATRGTTQRLKALGARTTETWNQVGVALPEEQFRWTDRRDALRVLYVGRLIPWKAVDFLIRGVAAATSDVVVDVIGDGPERERLERLCEELGAQGRVRFLGQVDYARVPSFIGDSDVLLHPSLHDSGGMVCAEAMAFGRPVIALRWAGPAEIVDESCGLLLDTAGGPCAVIQRIADALDLLSSDRALLRRLGDAARIRARAELTWDRRVRQLERVLTEVASQ